jgi:soluble lytic murein transglycosylase-like protein
MATLKLSVLAAGTVLATPAAAGVERWAPQIAEASLRFGLPESWIRSVIDAESGGETRIHGRPTTSSAGAMGLMQLMPRTWRDMRAAYRLGPDPHDPHDNIIAGAAYLRAMYDRFGYPGLFGAYNAGPSRYSDHLAGRRRLPAETIAYMARAGGAAAVPAPVAQSAEAPSLFVTIARAGADFIPHDPSSAPRVSDALFVPVGNSAQGQ